MQHRSLHSDKEKKKKVQTHFLKESCDHTDARPVVRTQTVSGRLVYNSIDTKPLSVCLLINSGRRRSENRKRVQFLPLWPRRHSGEDQLGAALQTVQEQEVFRNLEAVFSRSILMCFIQFVCAF